MTLVVNAAQVSGVSVRAAAAPTVRAQSSGSDPVDSRQVRAAATGSAKRSINSAAASAMHCETLYGAAAAAQRSPVVSGEISEAPERLKPTQHCSDQLARAAPTQASAISTRV